MTKIYSLAIAARAVINLHSLNNEGGEGNQIQTRMVNVFADGRLHNVNAISGDMFKHIQSEHLHRLAVQAGLPLSAGARLFNANRINYDVDTDAAFKEQLKKAKTNADELDLILRRCAVTDMAGVLVTADKRSLPRKSVVEFDGWLVFPVVSRLIPISTSSLRANVAAVAPALTSLVRFQASRRHFTVQHHRVNMQLWCR